MIEMTPLDGDYEFFSAETVEDIILLRFKKDLLVRTTDLQTTETLFKFIGRISNQVDIKVVVIINSPQKTGCEEYIEFYRKVYESKLGQYAMQRLYNSVDQFIEKIVSLNKIVIHADSGRVIPLFMNVSLACDYRIVADNTVFQNPCLELGLVPKGGSGFFLSKMLGRTKAYEIMLSDEDMSAQDALKLGIVNEVIPLEKLEEISLDRARRFARKPASTLQGIKRLLNYSLKDLQDYLKLENEVLIRIIKSSEFHKK
ncbi:MAG: enoyl-CoA hydratase/isomerase family protein [Deltaproteobacteria bacterium]|nr:enoyl-CoA hydratase/isomerase family protein [Deltaproteobacteria bacterium]